MAAEAQGGEAAEAQGGEASVAAEEALEAGPAEGPAVVHSESWPSTMSRLASPPGTSVC